jgi:DNA repair protein RecN (Recombination protein N)
VDPSLEHLRQQLHDATLLLEETSRDLQDFGMGQNTDPETLSQIDGRLDALYRLQRKHGKNIEDVLSLHAEMQKELLQLRDLDAHLAACEKKLQIQFAELHQEAKVLSERRREQAQGFAELICVELADLGMPHGRFEVCFEPLGENTVKTVTRNGTTLGTHGAENISFLFAANPGQKMGVLQAVASGGELSRTLLALKRVLQMADPVPITVFDEVDAGVGGGIGEIIGKKLASLGEFRQVFCVTHLGQIASQAHQHYRVTKEVIGKDTQTTVQALQGEARIEEVARMIGGEALTDVTLAHANEMVQSGSLRLSVN